jgi:predicted DNA binding protein
MITKDVATEFGISLSSVRRLLRKHGARLSDCHGAAGR